MKKSLVTLGSVAILTSLSAGHTLAAEHTVKEGDTLSNIALEANTTVKEIKSLNNLSSDLIFPGDKLNTSNEKAVETYTVKSGDTLSTIGDQFDVSYQDIMKWNHLDSDLIFVGQELTVNGENEALETSEPVEETSVNNEVATEEQEVSEPVEETSVNNEVATEEQEVSEPVEETSVNNEVATEEQEVSKPVEETSVNNEVATEEQEVSEPVEETSVNNEVATEEQEVSEPVEETPVNNEVETKETNDSNETYEAPKTENKNVESSAPVEKVNTESKQPSAAFGDAGTVAMNLAAGKSYQLGANSDSLVDCSSFTQQFMQQYKGKSISRTTYGQAAEGTPVSNPQPGDLVFFNDFSHVGVYIGNGQMVDALNPSEGVGLRDVSYVYGHVDGYYRF